MIKKILFLTVLVAFVQAAVPVGEGECVFYWRWNLQGEHFKMTAKLNQKDIRNSIGHFDDNIQSYECGKNTYARMCRLENFENCDGDMGWDLIGPLKVYEAPKADSISSILVQVHYADWYPCITIFVKEYFRGYSGVFCKGEHNIQDLRNNHVGNDEARSVIMDPGLLVRFYEASNFWGKQLDYNSGRSSRNGPPKKIATLPAGWNDVLSSLNVEFITEAATKYQARGYWTRAITCNGQCTKSFSEGYTQENSKSVTKSESTTISVSVSAEFEFAGSKVTEEVSSSHNREATQGIERSLSVSMQKTCTATITSPRLNVTYHVWQWNMDVVNIDNQQLNLQTKSCHYIFFDDEKQPMCPWGQCADAQCQTCKHGRVWIEDQQESELAYADNKEEDQPRGYQGAIITSTLLAFIGFGAYVASKKRDKEDAYQQLLDS